MINWIKLTVGDDEPVYVNMSSVLTIARKDMATRLSFEVPGHQSYIDVKEKPEIILNKQHDSRQPNQTKTNVPKKVPSVGPTRTEKVKKKRSGRR